MNPYGERSYRDNRYSYPLTAQRGKDRLRLQQQEEQARQQKRQEQALWIAGYVSTAHPEIYAEALAARAQLDMSWLPPKK
jgi:hypothetical protein